MVLTHPLISPSYASISYFPPKIPLWESGEKIASVLRTPFISLFSITVVLFPCVLQMKKQTESQWQKKADDEDRELALSLFLSLSMRISLRLSSKSRSMFLFRSLPPFSVNHLPPYHCFLKMQVFFTLHFHQSNIVTERNVQSRDKYETMVPF